MSTPNWEAIDQAIEVLNRICHVDKLALAQTLQYETSCSFLLQEDPTLQVASAVGWQPPQYSVLGLINSLFGWDPRGFAYIAAHYDEQGHLMGFKRTDPNAYVKPETTPPFSQEGQDAVNNLLMLIDNVHVLPAVTAYFATYGNSAPPVLIKDAITRLQELLNSCPK